MSRRSRFRVAAFLANALLGALGAAAGWAQDYTTTTTFGQIETRPTGATALAVKSNTAQTEADRSTVVDLPFEFPYYGTKTSRITVTAGGMILVRGVSLSNVLSPGSAHGQSSTSGAFPYTQTGTGGAGDHNCDGLIAALWTVLFINDNYSSGRVWSWVSGTAPDRRFVVSWEDAKAQSSGSALTVQIHLHETTGKIVFGYSPSGTYPTSSTGYVIGLDSPIDDRFVCPLTNGLGNTGRPPADYVFTPRTATFTGRLGYDKLVSDASGIGNTRIDGAPIAGCPVELRRKSDGFVYGSAVTDAEGDFTVGHVGGPGATPGELVVAASNVACGVGATPGGTPTSWTVDDDRSLAAGADLGAISLGSADDSTGTVRAAFNVAGVCRDVHAWAAARTSDTIPRLDVVYAASGSAETIYQPAGAAAASLTIGSPNSADQDAWDDGVVAQAYARHVLASIAAPPTVAYDDRFDAPTSPENAFAAAFGFAAWAAVSGAAEIADGRNASASTVLDLETPGTAHLGPTVAGAVAGGLFDLVDAANETADVVDGTGAAADRFFRVADASTVAPTLASFVQGWSDLGYDAGAMVRAMIGAGALVDDAAEPNDGPLEAPAFGDVGTVWTGLALQRFQEDWFTVTLAAPVSGLVADAAWSRTTYSATASLVLTNASGVPLATGGTTSAQGVVHLASGPLPAGTYRIGVAHLTGVAIPTYSLQVFTPIATAAAPFRDWTTGRAYVSALDVSGGVPPYTVTTSGQWSDLGLTIASNTFQIGGTPGQAGSFGFGVTVRDSGTPVNTATRNYQVTVNESVRFFVPPYVGFPVGVPAERELRQVGGTDPIARSLTGALPAGLSRTPDTFVLTGTAAEPGFASVSVQATDAAGSSDGASTRLVVGPKALPKNLPLHLAAGDAACGFYVDAVRGASLRFAVTTPKGAPRRTLAAVVLAPDGTVVQGLKTKATAGAVSCSKVPCTLSGRYFVVVTSPSGDATNLVGAASASAPPRAVKASVTTKPATLASTEVGALPGATLTFRASVSKRSGVTVEFSGLVAPDGTFLELAEGALKTVGTGFSLTAVLPEGGTWTVRFTTRPADGATTAVACTASLKTPRGATYSAD